jgi:hypothetical protein
MQPTPASSSQKRQQFFANLGAMLPRRLHYALLLLVSLSLKIATEKSCEYSLKVE